MATSAHRAPHRSPLPTSATIKELFDSGALDSAVPPEYCFRATQTDGDESAVEEEIPTIDLSLLCNGTDAQRKKAIQELGKACEEWGFFRVVNHGVPFGTMKAMLDAAQGFFFLPEAEKREYAGKNMLDPIRCGTSFNPAVEDIKYWRDYFKLIVHPVFTSPTKPPGFREALLDYATSTRKMTLELLRGINESLGLEEHCMETALDLDSGMQLVAGNFYPPCPQPEFAKGLPPHSDYGLLTVLLQNGVDGLQVKHGGHWVQVRSVPNSFLVNTGDQMEIFSNGRYKSVMHRAMLNNHAIRMSIATLQGPSLDTYVQPAFQLVHGNMQQMAYSGIKYMDYVDFQQKNQLKGKSALDLVRVPVEP
uniref:Putative 2-oxoglutarate/Fe(II)-dependent dioxygenase n=1 Tax=Anthurium amnicola TaxID=1678845 RepID=A0A1D1Y8F1_9ARAE